MKTKTYSIFGAGAAGLYTAWRLLSGKNSDKNKLLEKGDTLELYDWGQYDFSKDDNGSRAPGARVCTWHYQNDPGKSYVELGGMRYSEWDTKAKNHNNGKAPGHRLVTTVIHQLGLDKYVVPFNESDNPLYYLRGKNFYLNDVTSFNPAPYNVNNFAASTSPNRSFTTVENLAVTATTGPQTRREWDHFYQHGKITAELPASSVFQKGDKLKDIGYWNLMFDQLGSEGYNYAADGNGYTSNVINWNAAVAFQANNEFTPGNEYMTLTTGYSGMFKALFAAITELARNKGVHFNYQPNRRLHSILEIDNTIHYGIANRDDPNKKSSSGKTDAAWLAMPRYALELVAQATRYENHPGLDVLNHQKVQLYMESSIMQPSYKIGMFFKEPWWLTQAAYAPQLSGYEVTKDVIAQLAEQGFPASYLDKLAQPAAAGQPEIMNTPYSSDTSLLKAVEQRLQERLSVPQEGQLLTTSARNTIGPSVTDNPVRMVVYFGNNALDKTTEPVYGLLAAYDDEAFTTFWQGLELGPEQQRHVPLSENTEPLKGPRKVPDRMLKMLRKQLANIHFGPNADYSSVPEPLDAAYIDWSLPPFNAGYHAWAAHYDIGDVQQKIRKPSQLIPGADANIFIVGEAYSNDQAWVEGAYCTAESVLNDFFGVEPLIDNREYPFICASK